VCTRLQKIARTGDIKRHLNNLNSATLSIYVPGVPTSTFWFSVRTRPHTFFFLISYVRQDGQVKLVNWLAARQPRKCPGVNGSLWCFKVARYELELAGSLPSLSPSDKQVGFASGVCPCLHCDEYCTFFLLHCYYCGVSTKEQGDDEMQRRVVCAVLAQTIDVKTENKVAS
jgi:hypothetical protein